jgi:hypothetical protein
MVGDEVSGWNPFLNSLISLAEKLGKLGIIYCEDGVTYVELEEKHSYVLGYSRHIFALLLVY